MKKAFLAVLLPVLLFVFLCIGVMFGRRSLDEHMIISYEHIPLVTALETEPADPALLDINTASLEELIALPNIGEVLAQRIIDFRTERGAYVSIDDLLLVEGIGDAKLDSIRSFIRVGG